jgi:hypothetical protein
MIDKQEGRIRVLFAFGGRALLALSARNFGVETRELVPPVRANLKRVTPHGHHSATGPF